MGLLLFFCGLSVWCVPGVLTICLKPCFSGAGCRFHRRVQPEDDRFDRPSGLFAPLRLCLLDAGDSQCCMDRRGIFVNLSSVRGKGD